MAWEGESIRISDTAISTMAAAVEAFDRLIESDPEISVYGVTTGGGEYAKERLTAAKLEERVRGGFNLSLAFGEPLPERVARGIVLARLANHLGGHAAVRPELARMVAEMLDGPLPPVPTRGQGGSGEILPLGHLFAPLWELTSPGKESNGLINGSPCAASLAADAALAARRRMALAADVFALSTEAIYAPLENYGVALGKLWGDPYETEALAAIRERLAGASQPRRTYQTPVSWRILPRILGQAYRATAQLEEVATTSLQAVSDNPVFVPPDEDHALGQTFSTGGYHNAMVPPALDTLAGSWADLCLLAERHSTHLLDGAVSLLPDKLMAGTGWTYYLVFTQMGIGEEARRAAARTFLPPSSGGFAQSDIVAPSFFAYDAHQRTANCLDAALAVLAGLASQALLVTERPATPPLSDFLDEVRASFPPVIEGRPLGLDVDALRAAFTRRVYHEERP